MYGHFCQKQFSRGENGDIILTGERDNRSNLWKVPLGNANNLERDIKQQHTCAAVCNITPNKSMKSLIVYYHAAAFYPVIDTWVKAIQKEFFRWWPGLTAESARKYAENSIITDKGHLRQTYQNTQSTKRNENNNVAYVTIVDLRNKSYSD